jgi:hypothetical protein
LNPLAVLLAPVVLKTGRFLAQKGDSNLMKISVVISCYNEKNTIEDIVAA